MRFQLRRFRPAIEAAQRDEIRFPEFVKRVTAAGCVGYTAYLVGKRVTYVGRLGDSHTEFFSQEQIVAAMRENFNPHSTDHCKTDEGSLCRGPIAEPVFCRQGHRAAQSRENHSVDIPRIFDACSYQSFKSGAYRLIRFQ